jgi:hypothetical protein
MLIAVGFSEVISLKLVAFIKNHLNDAPLVLNIFSLDKRNKNDKFRNTSLTTFLDFIN